MSPLTASAIGPAEAKENRRGAALATLPCASRQARLLRYVDALPQAEIAHRLGSARFADRIVVMEQGRIVEQGAHDALMQQDGPYAKMFAAQADWYR